MSQSWLSTFKSKISDLRSECLTLYFALKHPQTPWYARALIVIVVGYAFSPIDLVPDFIPILGHLDDLLLVPLGVWLALKLIPEDVLPECREQAQEFAAKPKQPGFIIVVVLTWIALAALLIVWLSQFWR